MRRARSMALLRLAALAMMAPLMLAPPTAAKTPAVGEVAPNFQLSLADGTRLSLADLKGQVVVLNFSELSCWMCRRQLYWLDRYFQAHKDHPLRVYAMTFDHLVPQRDYKALFPNIPAITRFSGPYGITS